VLGEDGGSVGCLQLVCMPGGSCCTMAYTPYVGLQCDDHGRTECVQAGHEWQQQASISTDHP
jgi:hypothetical protein